MSFARRLLFLKCSPFSCLLIKMTESESEIYTLRKTSSELRKCAQSHSLSLPMKWERKTFISIIMTFLVGLWASRRRRLSLWEICSRRLKWRNEFLYSISSSFGKRKKMKKGKKKFQAIFPFCSMSSLISNFCGDIKRQTIEAWKPWRRQKTRCWWSKDVADLYFRKYFQSLILKFRAFFLYLVTLPKKRKKAWWWWVEIFQISKLNKFSLVSLLCKKEKINIYIERRKNNLLCAWNFFYHIPRFMCREILGNFLSEWI